MIKALIGKRYYDTPTEWNELSRRQLLAVHRCFESGEEVEAALFRLLKILTGMSWWRFVFTPASELMEFLYLTHFLIKETNLTAQLLPRYRGLYGPASEFRNLIMCEFANTEHYYMQWEAQEKEQAGSGEETHLDNLIAILYRPAKKGYNHRLNPDGDPRIPFNENLCAFNATHKVRKWPRHVKTAIASWYAACRQKLVGDNPDVFGGSGENARYGLLSVMRQVADKGVHGDFDKVQFKPVYLIMVELNEMVAESKNQPPVPSA